MRSSRSHAASDVPVARRIVSEVRALPPPENGKYSTCVYDPDPAQNSNGFFTQVVLLAPDEVAQFSSITPDYLADLGGTRVENLGDYSFVWVNDWDGLGADVVDGNLEYQFRTLHSDPQYSRPEIMLRGVEALYRALRP